MKNYQYQIEKENDKIRIFEFTSTYGSRIGSLWDINNLKKTLQEFEKSDFPYKDKEEQIKASFQRTKHWVMENFPEYFL